MYPPLATIDDDEQRILWLILHSLPLSPDCGQQRWHCLDHLLLLTDTNPTVISQVQQASLYLPPRDLARRLGSLSLLHSAAHSQQHSASDAASARRPVGGSQPHPLPPSFPHTIIPCFLSALSLSLSSVRILFRLFFFFCLASVSSVIAIARASPVGGMVSPPASAPVM